MSAVNVITVEIYLFHQIKVPILNEILSSLKCVQIAGGSKSLFCGENQMIDCSFG